MIPLWKGSANTWDCDEMGHVNVRVYLEKAYEGVGSFAAAIGMTDAFRSGAIATLIPTEQHIRYIREVHAGRPITMSGCVLDWDETSVLLYQDMRHADGSPAAAFRTRLVHAAAASGRPFPWNSRAREALDQLKDTPPPETAPRGLDMSVEPLPDSETTMAAIEACGAPEIGRGLVLPQHCDAHGRMLNAWFMGRLSDSVPNLLFDWRRKVAERAAGGTETGGAVLEYRMIYRNWPRAGDRFVAHTALAGVAEKTHSLAHWVMNPDTGQAYVTSQAVAVTFNIKTRKVIPTPQEEIAELEKLAPRGLAI